ncbi:expressed unknown protein [Seminavis robusta]|uniref:Uncharacterized protein n=1 Tax=Seminavis robusta TaxID=568900 RepID=A0A9N8HPD4_9STRA|nr:expressed unknown protein [Seminavis robusta]|eukprot:Sro1077_g238580.1 n/a (174) ;mRNA; f:12711-13232
MGNSESVPQQRRGRSPKDGRRRSRSMDHSLAKEMMAITAANCSPTSTNSDKIGKPTAGGTRKTPGRAKSFESSVVSKREMREIPSGNKSGTRKNVRASSKSRSSRKITSNSNSITLGDQDLDEIYDFVNQMKETNLGGNMLEEFVVRQAEDIQTSEMGGKPSLHSVPIQIEIS